MFYLFGLSFRFIYVPIDSVNITINKKILNMMSKLVIIFLL
ncbi:hypothetical protein BAZSYMA_ACONTIG130127_1 [Bathymodiolus azoricus thioautotrophic gill symbiont]|uniref:Uncharacterized protein n=1 Tax=Bathymodiolus azoricus thioautotrophic gill symbiont TaxID=235205 RepID=A0A1H6LVQ4_9GAMM|nr:hypothetical protein BAZSYMA_ACONTIG130127_1 [Bathymodiolus azoricus thioautotrophic gill symbiont]